MALPSTSVLISELYQLRQRIDSLQFRIVKAKKLERMKAAELADEQVRTCQKPRRDTFSFEAMPARYVLRPQQRVIEKRSVADLEARLEGLKRTQRSIKHLFALINNATINAAAQQQSAVHNSTTTIEQEEVSSEPSLTAPASPVIQEPQPQPQPEPVQPVIAELPQVVEAIPAPIEEPAILIETVTEPTTPSSTPSLSQPIEATIEDPSTTSSTQEIGTPSSTRAQSFIMSLIAQHTSKSKTSAIVEVAQAAVAIYCFARMLMPLQVV